MIAKLEWTQSSTQQNIEQLQDPKLGVAINNESTTTEPPPQNGQQLKPVGVGGLKCILLVSNLRPISSSAYHSLWYFPFKDRNLQSYFLLVEPQRIKSLKVMPFMS